MIWRNSIVAAAAYLLAASVGSAADKTVAACQYLAASGLEWDGGRWVPQHYTASAPFFLTVMDGALDPSSVGAIMLDLQGPDWINCAPRFGSYEICSASIIGRTMFFDHDGMQGSVAYLGASAKNNRQDGLRDSLVVMPFVCQAM